MPSASGFDVADIRKLEAEIIVVTANNPTLCNDLLRHSSLSSCAFVILQHDHSMTLDVERNGISLLQKPIRAARLLRACKSALSTVNTTWKAHNASLSSMNISPQPPDSHTYSQGNSARVLVVEDNEVNQMVISVMLEKLGHIPTIVSSGEQALELLARVDAEPYDAVLMDCQMPGMDGYETTKCIRAAEAKAQSHIPIIALTASALKGDRERCISVGMDSYLTKPISIQALSAGLTPYISGTKGSASEFGPIPDQPRFSLDLSAISSANISATISTEASSEASRGNTASGSPILRAAGGISFIPANATVLCERI